MSENHDNKELSSEILTIVFVDIVGYTKTTNRSSRKSFAQLHDIFDKISVSTCEQYGGRVIKKIGDAFLFAFKSPTNALLCGINLQNSFDTYNKDQSPTKPIKIRVAAHTGEVIVREGDIYGDAVNAAARIEGLAEAREIVFSEAVFLAMNKNEIPFVHLGLKKLRGLKYPVRLFRVKGHYDKILRKRKIRRRRKRRIKRTILAFLFLGIIALGAFYLVQYFLPALGLL